MKKSSRYPLVVAAAATLAGVMVACESSTEVSLVNDAAVTADVAASAGDAVATAVSTMIGNESTAQLSSVEAPPDGPPSSNATDNSGVVPTRSRTCLDASGATVANCSPLSSVRKIITTVTLDGTRTGSNDTETKTWTGAVHRAILDTLTRVFNTAQPPVETSREHDGTATANDTTTFTEGDFSRKLVEAAVDSVQSVTFALPRSANPWPTSGSIVRVVQVKVTVTRGDRTETKDFSVRIQVDFPADAQGNVVLTINTKTCNLNLVTHAVTACT